MSDFRTNQILIAPLFGVEIESTLQISITEPQFVERMTAHLFPKPIPLNTGENPPSNNAPVPVPIPAPKTTVRIVPYSPGCVSNETSDLTHRGELPQDFNVFDNLGPFALRAGSGGLGGFQTITTLSTKKHATAVLVIEFDQVYPRIAAPLLSSRNPYESNIAESILDALRLLSGQEPHPYKGFHLNDGKFVNVIIKWPLVEIQGAPIEIASLDPAKIENVFYQAWRVRTAAKQYPSFRIVLLALEYYYLSSTMTQFRTIFLYLMIAFEAMFKMNDEDSASAASSRLARLLAENKKQYTEITRFMWNTKEKAGCCQVRNEIVHGNVSSLKSDMYWKLRGLLRVGILRIASLLVAGEIDKHSYYDSLSDFLNRRFGALPNS